MSEYTTRVPVECVQEIERLRRQLDDAHKLLDEMSNVLGRAMAYIRCDECPPGGECESCEKMHQRCNEVLGKVRLGVTGVRYEGSQNVPGVCDDHQWPYGVDLDGDNRPRCVWCEALRADTLERLMVDATWLLKNSSANTKFCDPIEWGKKFGKWWADVHCKHPAGVTGVKEDGK